MVDENKKLVFRDAASGECTRCAAAEAQRDELVHVLVASTVAAHVPGHVLITRELADLVPALVDEVRLIQARVKLGEERALAAEKAKLAEERAERLAEQGK